MLQMQKNNIQLFSQGIRIAFFEVWKYDGDYVNSLTNDQICHVLAEDEDYTFAMTLEEFEHEVNVGRVDMENNFIRFFMG